MKILLNKKQSKSSRNVKNSLLLHFKSSRKLLPSEPIKELVDEYEEYLTEREPCTKVRLTCSVNAVCSNVLFNNLTEAVIDEGSDNSKLYDNDEVKGLYGKEKVHLVTSDTQLTRPTIGYKYHCGLDIFNNHTLRSKTFSSIAQYSSKCNPKETNEDGGFDVYFNTLADYDRDCNGKCIKQYTDRGGSKMKHVYSYDTLLSFKDCVSTKLIEENGWFGFKNVSKFPMFKNEANGGIYEKYDFSSTINYKNGGDFVELCPERDLFSFSPKFNKSRNRIEKNWNYCVTYPSSSTTDIEFIDEETNGLKAIYFDDEVISSGGVDGIKIYSISKHGLSVGDYVNIYVGSGLTLNTVKVLEVEDDFVFTVFKNSTNLTESWESVSDILEEGGEKSEDGRSISISGSTYFIVNKTKVNTDENSQRLSYKRVVGGIECEYYVRLFSRLPNWRFKTEEPTFYNLYQKEGSTLLKDFSTYENEFESHVGKLAFAKNIYGDDLGEIVFNDTLDIANLKDNLGRPLTSIYLTIIKNNKGYKEWYEDNDFSSETVEFSHVFGKVNCAFRLSEESLADAELTNVTRIHNLEGGSKGLNVSHFRNETEEDDEIVYEKDEFFYGDLCCYSKYVCEEQVIEPIEFRFNTAQRELGLYETKVEYEEIKSDDFDGGFSLEHKELDDSVLRKEGYCYVPHYEIQVRTFSENLSSAYPIFYKIRNIAYGEDNVVTIQTMNSCQLRKNQKFYIYDKETRSKYELYVSNVIGLKKFTVTDENFPSGLLPTNTILFVVDEDEIPSHATFVYDGSCRYYWRDVMQNGFDETNQIEVYPFTNGHLYINKNINLYLKRQDPKGVNGLWSIDYPYSFDSNLMDKKHDDNYYNSEDIEC